MTARRRIASLAAAAGVAAGEPVRVSSPGPFDFTPRVELDLGYYGVVMVLWSNQQLRDEIVQIQTLARDEIAACTAPAPSGVAASSPAGPAALAFALASRQRRSSRLTPPGFPPSRVRRARRSYRGRHDPHGERDPACKRKLPSMIEPVSAIGSAVCR